MKQFFTILSLIMFSAGIAQQMQETNNLDEQNKKAITKLQQNDSIQNQSIKQLNKNMDDVKEDSQKAEGVYNAAKEMMSIKDSTFNWVIAAIGVFLTLLAIIIAIFGFNLKQSKEEVKAHAENLKKQYAEEIAKIAEREKHIVQDLVKEHQKKFNLLNISKILILNQKGSGLEKKMEMLKKRFSSIEQVDIKDIMEYNFYNGNNWDAVILENFSNKDDIKPWNFNDEELKKKLVDIAESIVVKDIAFLYFGPDKTDGRFKDDDILKEHLHLINFANIPSTLFTNLNNLLDFRRLIKETEEFLNAENQ